MSKSPNYLVPTLGGIALVLGVAYGATSRGYKAEEAELARAQAEAAQASAAAQLAENAELQAKIEAVQSEANGRIAELEARPVARSLTAPAPVINAKFGLGRAAHVDEVKAWDVDVLPDGRGLPPGAGDVLAGEEVFADKCAACHGDFAEGVDNWPVLAGGFDTLGDKDPVKTVGSYWPHLSTAWDYIHRSMPFGDAGTLTTDETYAIVAYILYSNDLVDEGFELSHENFKEFEMYNKDGFVVDDRPQREYDVWRAEPCMENCKNSVEITMRATFLDVTPEDGGESVMNHASISETPTFTAASTDAEQSSSDGDVHSDLDPALLAAGEKVFRKCKACHEVGAGAKNKSGPQLNAVLGRAIGSVDGFGYSGVFKAALDDGRVWDEASLEAFLTKPKDYMEGTKMSFAGLRKEEDLKAITAYLKSFGD